MRAVIPCGRQRIALRGQRADDSNDRTKVLSVKLQSRYVDVVRAYREVSFVKSALRSTRETVNAFHSRVYSKAMHIASMVNVQECVP